MEKCKKKRKQEVANAKENGMVEQEAASVAAAVLALEGMPKFKKEEAKVKEVVMVEQEDTTVTVSALDEMPKCKKKKDAKAKEGVMAGQEADTTSCPAITAVSALVEMPKCKEAKAKEGVMAGQEAATTAVSALVEMPKCKKEEEAKVKEGVMAGQEAATTAVSALVEMPKCKKKKEAKVKEGVMAGQEATTTAVSVLDEMPKCKKKEAKAKEGVMAGQEAATTAVSALDETPKCKKEKAKERRMVEQGATTSAVSAMEGTPRCKKEKKAKEKGMTEQEAIITTVSALEGTPKCNKKEKVNERGIVEQEATTTTVLALEGTLKCKKKEKRKETVIDEPEPSTAISALEGTEKYKIKGEKGNETGLAKQETTAAVSALEGTTKRKRRKLGNNKMQEQQESAQELSGLVTVDIIMANKPGNGGTNGEGASGDADVSMDPINAEDPNCSKAKDANDKVKCESQEGNKNCSENFSSLQEGSENRKRQRKREKRKGKRDASNRGPDISSQDESRVAKPCLDSSMDHDVSCICASCSVQAHKEKVKNIYSPRGSLIRFQRKKLLILDLNGLLADITMDKQNEHTAHAKVKGKLVFRRPYYDEFLRFCFQNFELGIWSSRKMENVKSVVDILMHDLKQYLLFCWDMSKCTFTGCKVIGDKHKPLVLKELKKLWDKEDPNLPWEQGEFSPSNTLLVDDSPYKALCNPPHTAIFPQPYSYLNQKDDYSLGPGGDLRVYLEKLAAAVDVQVFVRDNPFGQPSITESDPKWNFYAKIVHNVERGLSLKWNQGTNKPA